MYPDPLESSLIFILLQICFDFATHRKKLHVRKFGMPLLCYVDGLEIKDTTTTTISGGNYQIRPLK